MGRDNTGKDHLDLIGPFAFAHSALHLLEPSEPRRLHLLVHLFHNCVCLDGILFACHLHADDARDIVDGNGRHGTCPARSGKIRVERGACSRGDVAQHGEDFFVVNANAAWRLFLWEASFQFQSFKNRDWMVHGMERASTIVLLLALHLLVETPRTASLPLPTVVAARSGQWPERRMLLRGGFSPRFSRGVQDEREYAEAGKAIRSPQHLVDEWIEQNFPLQTRREWGHACLGLGACCAVCALFPLPLLRCFLSRELILSSNVLLTAGAFLVSGPSSIRRFVFAPRRRLGTLILVAGVTFLWRHWTLMGVLFQLFGFLGLFGPFLEGFPLVCPPLPTTVTDLVEQAKGLCATISAPLRRFVGDLARA